METLALILFVGSAVYLTVNGLKVFFMGGFNTPMKVALVLLVLSLMKIVL